MVQTRQFFLIVNSLLLPVLAWVLPGVLLYTVQCESLSCRMDEKCGTWGRASGRIFPRRKWPNNCIHIMPVREAKYTEEGKMCRIRIVWRRDVSLGVAAPAGKPTATRNSFRNLKRKKKIPTFHLTGLFSRFFFHSSATVNKLDKLFHWAAWL